jgi:hypothetical protein
VLVADQIAKEAEFFSFGTNDLTQTTMGLSRDDYTKFSAEYEAVKVFKADPFASIDQEGVGMMIEMGIKLGRSTTPDLEIGICGRARRRSQLRGILLPRGDELRVVLAVSYSDRTSGCGAGGDFRRQERHDAHGAELAGWVKDSDSGRADFEFFSAGVVFLGAEHAGEAFHPLRKPRVVGTPGHSNRG